MWPSAVMLLVWPLIGFSAGPLKNRVIRAGGICAKIL
jgi:hypothetical protein